MFQVGVLILIGVSICHATVPTSSTPEPVLCGEIPQNIYRCLGNLKVVKPEVSQQCDKSSSECDRMRCIFLKSLWLSLDGEIVDKPKVIAHFEQFAKEHPEWATAVQHVKTKCLANDLPPQGAYINCPAYDIMICTLGAFVKNAHPSQWSSATECSYTRQFAASCPVCPGDCFAPLVPYGSCRACVSLPRSP